MGTDPILFKAAMSADTSVPFQEERAMNEAIPRLAPAEPRVDKSLVFISHKQGIDNEIALYLYEELTQRNFEVYLDLMMRPGVDYKAAIKENLDKADFFIVLVSSDSNESDWVREEVFQANERNKTAGRPALIPVRIGMDAQLYNPDVGACLSRFVPIQWEHERDDKRELLDQVISGLTHKQTELRVPYDMEGFVVNGTRKKQILEGFVPPSSTIGSKLDFKHQLVWISGDADVRNYLALGVAVKQQEKHEPIKIVFDIPSSKPWSEFSKKNIRNAIIVFRDVNPEPHFNEQSPQKEIAALLAIAKQNMVILTADAAPFAQIEYEMRRMAITAYSQIEVRPADYDESSKFMILEKLLNFSNDHSLITASQFKLASNLLDESTQAGSTSGDQALWMEANRKFRQRLASWSPADIEHFILLSLPQAKGRSDLLRLLQRRMVLEDEIHSWLMALDSSTCCFLMALTLFSGKRENELWDRYKTIVGDLKPLNPQLALLPLGVCRQLTTPFVRQDGPMNFLDERVANAIREELAKNYREYFVEILPRLKDWSVAGEGPVPEQKIEEIRETRAAIAQMTGRIAKHRLDDVKELLNFWAGKSEKKIRDAVSIALQYVAADDAMAEQVLDLLKDWCSDFSTPQSLFRAWAAAIALGDVVSANPAGSYLSKGLEYLGSLVYDNRNRVRSFLATSLRKIARKVALREIAGLLERTARKAREKDEISVLIHLGAALNQASLLNPQEAADLYAQWVASPAANLRWIAFCSLVIKRRPERSARVEKTRELERLLLLDNITVIDVLVSMRSENYYKEIAEETFKQLIESLNDDTRGELVEALAKMGDEDRSLLGLLKEIDASGSQSLVIEIYEQRWKQLLDQPATLLASIGEALRQKPTIREGFTALVSLLEPEPAGCRNQLTTALADCYAQERQLVHDTLELLGQIAPAHFQPFIYEVYLAAYRTLLLEPATFVQFVKGALSHPVFASEMQRVLESLATPEPEGCANELLRALGLAYSTDAGSVEQLISMWNDCDNPVLRTLALNFKYYLLKAILADPLNFVFRLAQSLPHPQQWQDTLNILQLLATPGPQGSRPRLVDALAEAKGRDASNVDQLLKNPILKERPYLADLDAEVQHAMSLRKFFIPRILSDFFRAKA